MEDREVQERDRQGVNGVFCKVSHYNVLLYLHSPFDVLSQCQRRVFVRAGSIGRKNVIMPTKDKVRAYLGLEDITGKSNRKKNGLILASW